MRNEATFPPKRENLLYFFESVLKDKKSLYKLNISENGIGKRKFYIQKDKARRQIKQNN